MNIQNTILIDKLRQEMARAGINARQLADKAEVGRSFIYDILNGRSKNPTTKKLSAIADILGVDLNQLISEVEREDALHDPAAMLHHVVAIPSVEVEASMGMGSFVVEEQPGTPFYFKREWINGLQGFDNDLRVISVRGNSMSPTLEDKDHVLVDFSQTRPTPPGVFAIHDGMGLMVKRLQYIHSDTQPYVRIISDNPQFTAVEQPLEEINIIGRVVWLCRDL